MLFHGDTEIGEFEWVGRRDAQAYCRIAHDSWTCRIDSRWPVQISIIGHGASPRLMYAGSFGEGRAELSRPGPHPELLGLVSVRDVG